MSQNKDPKKHHYVPRFYLKRWFNQENEIFIYKKGRCDYEKKIAVSKPKQSIEDSKDKILENFCQENDLYSLLDVPEDQKQIMEKDYFSKLDSEASNIINKFDVGLVNNLSDEERSSWISFLLSLIFRSPAGLDNFYQAAQKCYDKFNEENNYPEELKKFSVKNNVLLYLPQACVKQEFGDILINLMWFVIKTDGHQLTSDMPLVKIGGLDLDILLWCFPLDPNKVFCMTNDSNVVNWYLNNKARKNIKYDIRKVANPNISKELNHNIIDQSKRFIFASDLSNQALIKKKFNTTN